jgi:chromosome segregation ATPase
MSSDKGLEVRVTAVEGELVILRQDVTEVKTMAADASRDAGDCKAALREQKASLDSMRATQLEHGVTLKKLAKAQEKLEDKHEKLADELISRFAELGVTQLEQANHLQVLSTQVGELTTMVRTLADSVEPLLGNIMVEQLQQRQESHGLREEQRQQREDMQGLRKEQFQQRGDMQGLRADLNKMRLEHRSDVVELKAGLSRIEQLLRGNGGDPGKSGS